MTDTELWMMFNKYERKVAEYSLNAEHRLASATALNAIARIIAAREGNGTST